VRWGVKGCYAIRIAGAGYGFGTLHGKKRSGERKEKAEPDVIAPAADACSTHTDPNLY